MSSNISSFSHYRIIRQHILTSLIESRQFAKGKLLDIGCATKPYKDIFKDCVTEHIGIDYPTKIACNHDTKNVEAFAILPKLPFPNESFDTILMTEVLEHISEPSGAFKEVYRVLKPDGHLILTTPQSWALHEAPYDYYRYTRCGLQYLAEKSGFKVEYIKPFGGVFCLIGQKLSIFIFYRLAMSRGFKPRPALIKFPVLMICAIVQFTFLSLDGLWQPNEDTLGHIMVAKKDINAVDIKTP